MYCPVRNQLQDALGYALIQPKEAKKYVYDVLKLQKNNGFIKQWYMTDGSPERALCLLNHSDGPIWLIIEHLLKAVTYMYEERGNLGYDDDGNPVGHAEDNDRLFLNTQTWALIAGVVTEEQMPVMLKNLERLETSFGLILLDPPFDAWDKRWGRISIKKSGTTENTSNQSG